MRTWTRRGAIALLLASGCSKSQSAPESANSATQPAISAARGGVSALPIPQSPPTCAKRHDEPSSENVKAYAEASNALALDLYAKLKPGSGNLAFSPTSIAVALTMTWAGARGETATEMARVLHLVDPPEAVHQAAASWIRRWNEPRPGGYELRVANRIFPNSRYAPVPSFVATLSCYRAEFESLSFDDPERARKRINDWVESATQRRIRELIPPGGIQAITALVLTNAVYFLGRWTKRFDPKDTAEDPFYLSDHRTVQVPIMHRTDTYQYVRLPNAEVIELPYLGDDLAMTIVLPRRRTGLAALERTLSLQDLERATRNLKAASVKLALPRFRIDPAASLALRPILSGLGMKLAFSSAADFTGMVADRGLYIDDVYHKAFVRVDEEGTEAAAATAVVMKPAAVAPLEPIEFRADHPFLFFIRSLDSGAILFLGRLNDPSRQ